MDGGREWRTIPSFPNYQASDHREVRRSRPGQSNRARVGKLLTPAVSNRGYHVVTLCSGGKVRQGLVHRLVCEAFHGPSLSAVHQTAHANAIKTDNRPSNLRWATAKENHGDTVLHDGQVRGERCVQSKLKSDDVLSMRSRYPAVSASDLARQFNVSLTHVCKIVHRQAWAHLP